MQNDDAAMSGGDAGPTSTCHHAAHRTRWSGEGHRADTTGPVSSTTDHLVSGSGLPCGGVVDCCRGYRAESSTRRRRGGVDGRRHRRCPRRAAATAPVGRPGGPVPVGGGVHRPDGSRRCRGGVRCSPRAGHPPLAVRHRHHRGEDRGSVLRPRVRTPPGRDGHRRCAHRDGHRPPPPTEMATAGDRAGRVGGRVGAGAPGGTVGVRGGHGAALPSTCAQRGPGDGCGHAVRDRAGPRPGDRRGRWRCPDGAAGFGRGRRP